jgi:hypothetical protein
MQVKTAGVADRFPPGGKIKAIQEDGANFSLLFEDGPPLNLQLADPRPRALALRERALCRCRWLRGVQSSIERERPGEICYHFVTRCPAIRTSA